MRAWAGMVVNEDDAEDPAPELCDIVWAGCCGCLRVRKSTNGVTYSTSMAAFVGVTGGASGLGCGALCGVCGGCGVCAAGGVCTLGEGEGCCFLWNLSDTFWNIVHKGSSGRYAR